MHRKEKDRDTFKTFSIMILAKPNKMSHIYG